MCVQEQLLHSKERGVLVFALGFRDPHTGPGGAVTAALVLQPHTDS